MTESQYLSSTDPAAMRTLLVERGLWVEKKCRAFVEACRWEWDRIKKFREGRWGRYPDALSNAEWWSDETGHDLNRAFRAALIRDIFGNPWRQYVVFNERVHAPELHPYRINPDWLTYANGNVVKLARAAVTRECERCGGVGEIQWLVSHSGEQVTMCPSCPNGSGTIPITGPIDPLRLAVLADALEEAGCADDGLLGHLRQTHCVCDCGVCINGKSGRCICGESSTRPVQHVWTPSGGCWVIDLLLHHAPVVTVE